MTRAITRSHALGLAVLTDVMRHRLARWDAGGEARCADVFLRSGPSLALRLRLRPFRQPRYTRERAMVEDANEDAGSSAHLGEVALLLLCFLKFKGALELPLELPLCSACSSMCLGS